LDAKSEMQTRIWVTYSGFIVSWFCFLFVIRTMNPPRRAVSALVLATFAGAAVYAIVSGFVMRKKFLVQSTEVLRSDPSKAASHWRMAHSIGFTFAMSVTIFGVALKLLGTGWLLPGMFFAVSLGLLVLWRPARSGLQS
jgi:hypothetical protein